MSDRPTPTIDRVLENLSQAQLRGSDAFEVLEFHARDLERKLAEARVALQWAQSQLGKHTRPSPIDKALASIDEKGGE